MSKARWIGRAHRLVGGDDGQRGIAVERLGDDLFARLDHKVERGRRQQVAEVESPLNRPRRLEEIATGTARRPCAGFDRPVVADRPFSDQQRSEVRRRHRNPVDHDLRHVDRAVGDHEDFAAGRGEDEIATAHLEIVEGYAGGQDDEPFAVGQQRDRPSGGHDPRHDDCAFEDHVDLAIGRGDDEVATDHLEIVEGDTGGQNDDALGVGQKRHRIGG